MNMDVRNFIDQHAMRAAGFNVVDGMMNHVHVTQHPAAVMNVTMTAAAPTAAAQYGHTKPPEVVMTMPAQAIINIVQGNMNAAHMMAQQQQQQQQRQQQQQQRMQQQHNGYNSHGMIKVEAAEYDQRGMPHLIYN